MGANLVTGFDPFSNLGGVHQRFGRFANWNVPLVALSDQVGDQKLDGAEPVFGEWRQRIFKNVAKTIVETQNDFSTPGLAADYLHQFWRLESGPPQFRELSLKSFLRGIEAFTSGARRAPAGFVVNQN